MLKKKVIKWFAKPSVPVLHVSFMSRQRSLTDEALRPRAAPIVAQSFPCFSLNLKTHKTKLQSSSRCFLSRKKETCGCFTHAFSFSISSGVYLIERKETDQAAALANNKASLCIWLRRPHEPTCRRGCGCHTFVKLACRRRTAACSTPTPRSGRNPSFPLWTSQIWPL